MKRKTIILIILSISLLLLLSIGFTYSFFSTQLSGEGTDNIVEAGTLSLHFEDGPEIVLNGAVPGESVEKEFTVTNTGTLETNYTIWWKELFNGILYDELVMSFECKSYRNDIVEGTCDGLSEIPIGTNSSVPIKSSIPIDPGITHKYSLKVTFKEMNKDQNYNQGKNFKGIINIKEYFLNETDVPIIESYKLSNKTLTAKVSDLVGVTHYAISYIDDSIASILKNSVASVMKLSTKASNNNLNWIEVKKETVVTIETKIEDYKVILHVKNTAGNIISHDLTPKPVIKINPNGGVWKGSTGEQTYNLIYKETMSIEDPTREGFDFINWEYTGEENKLSNKTFTAGIEDTTLEAQWERNTFILTLDPNGGTYNNNTSNTTFNMKYKTSKEIEEPTREGYTFTGWNVSSDKANLSGTTLTIGSEDVTLTASWEANDYPWIAYHNKMNTNGEGYTLVDADTKEGAAKFGSKITPNVNTYTGFTSPSEQTITMVVDTTPPTKNVVNYNYDRNKYALTIIPSPGTYSGNNPGEVYYEEEIEIANPIRTGYNFTRWEVTGKGNISGTTFKGGLSESTLKAEWEPQKYIVTFNTNGGKVLSENTKEVIYDSTYGELPEPTRKGYSFIGWYTQADGGQRITPETKVEITSEQEIYAQWDINEYNVQISVNNGTSDKTTDISEYNTNIIFNLTGNENYKFANATCTNSQDALYELGVLTIENISDNTECTVNYVSELNEPTDEPTYKIKIFANAPEAATAQNIYNEDDWVYNSEQGCYEKSFNYSSNITLPDPSSLFKINGYKDTNNYDYKTKEIADYFYVIGVYPAVGGIANVMDMRGGSRNYRLFSILWMMKAPAAHGSYNQHMIFEKLSTGYYTIKLKNTYTNSGVTTTEYYPIAASSTAGYGTIFGNSSITSATTWIGYSTEINAGNYDRFGKWHEVHNKLESEIDENDIYQQWAIIYDSSTDFFYIKNRGADGYLRGGSSIANVNKYDCSTSLSKYYCLNVTDDPSVIYSGDYEIPLIVTDQFNESDNFRWELSPYKNVYDGINKVEYYKYSNYGDTSEEYEQYVPGEVEFYDYNSTVTEYDHKVSRGTSNYDLSNIDGDILYLYPEWNKVN